MQSPGVILAFCTLAALFAAAGAVRADDTTLYYAPPGPRVTGVGPPRAFIGPMPRRFMGPGPFGRPMGGPMMGGPMMGGPMRPGPRAFEPRFDPPRGRVCFSPAETRDRIAAHGLTDPFRAFRNGRLQGDALRARLCRWKPDEFVYEVSVLRRDGRIVHVYMNAQNGQTVGALSEPDLH